MPLKVLKKERGDSNRLIEEFMLLANKKVATVLSPYPSLYRVHDLPSKEKMADLAFFLRSLGHKVSLRDGIIPTHEINKLLENLEEKCKENLVILCIEPSLDRWRKPFIRPKTLDTMDWHFYTTLTLLAIRRYPDIIIHRCFKIFFLEK